MAHRRTFSRFLNERGYGYFVARRKGIVSGKGRGLRLKYARKMKRELVRNSEFFNDEVAFYLDGVSFVHKQNPRIHHDKVPTLVLCTLQVGLFHYQSFRHTYSVLVVWCK